LANRIHVDVSENNDVTIDSSYDLPFFMFRLVNEFGNIDELAADNLAGARKLFDAGKLVNFGGYVNPGHASNQTFLDAIDNLAFPRGAVIMLDAEHWPGEGPNGGDLISGDHSSQFNDLATNVRARQGGRADLVWGYGNRGDLSSLWPSRPSWLGVVVASYNTNSPDDDTAGCVGWQYTDGAQGNTANRWSTPPFGHCDHNLMFIDYPLPTGDWLSMASLDDVKTAVRQVLNEGTGDVPFADRFRRLSNRIAALLPSGVADKAETVNRDELFTALAKANVFPRLNANGDVDYSVPATLGGIVAHVDDRVADIKGDHATAAQVAAVKALVPALDEIASTVVAAVVPALPVGTLTVDQVTRIVHDAVHAAIARPPS
jgi:hypothetical protein